MSWRTLRVILATTFTTWAMHLLRPGEPGRAALAVAQIQMCKAERERIGSVT
jgi:hypothetical protein